MLATATLLGACLASSCATSGAGAKTEKQPLYADVRIWAITKTETAYPDGMISGVVTRSYDEKGNQVSEETYSGEKTLTSKKSFSVGSDGTTTVLTSDSAGATLGKSIRTIKDGLLVTEVQTNPKGEFQASEEYEYDAKGNKTRWTVKTATGSMVATEYGYESGRLAAITVRDAAGSIVKKFVKVYPEPKPAVGAAEQGKGKAKEDAKAKDAAAKLAAAEMANALPLAEEEYDAAGSLVSRKLLTWDGRFLAKEERKNAFGATLSTTTYRNDLDGNPIEIAYADRTGRVIEIKRQTWAPFTVRTKVR
jgi:major membrane immunogen (membrane-anchored lipoprotein)